MQNADKIGDVDETQRKKRQFTFRLDSGQCPHRTTAYTTQQLHMLLQRARQIHDTSHFLSFSVLLRLFCDGHHEYRSAGNEKKKARKNAEKQQRGRLKRNPHRIKAQSLY